MRKRINTTIKETISVKNREWYLLYLIYITKNMAFYGTPFVEIRNKANMQYKLD